MTQKENENLERVNQVKTALKLDDLKLYDVRENPFRIYGLHEPEKGGNFNRLPDDVAKNVSENVAMLAKHTAGGRVRFKTDSEYIVIKAIMKEITRFPHMPLTGTTGFDLYQNEGGIGIYKGSFIPPVDITDGYESIIRFESSIMRDITIHFPLYNDVQDLYVGLKENSKLEKADRYKHNKLILYYGSSITQGGCASRPGNSYQNIISAKLGCDHLNLGFSGSALAEDAIVNYMASLEFDIFVCDYDHNAHNVEYLEKTHEKMFLKIREAKPKVPVVFMTKPDFDSYFNYNILRRDVVYKTYMNAIKREDYNVYYIDGHSLFKDSNRDACTVDTCHPNDAGFVRMAEVLGHVLDGILRNTKK